MNNIKFDNLYQNLNAEQKDAVDSIEGPVLVIAGPGTGKTQILSMRIANILLKTDTQPYNILALTFTESGVNAMRERLFSIIGLESYKINIYTFHSFCQDLITNFPDKFISNSSFKLISDIERVSIFKNIIDQTDLYKLKPFNAPYYYIRTITSKIKELKREGIDPYKFEEYIKSSTELKDEDIDKNFELLKVYIKYQEILKEKGLYDFEDMINYAVDVLLKDENFLLELQEKYHYILVDEFQDTNNAQLKLLYLLAEYWGAQANIFAVGDDDQAIYRFQGASTENIISFLNKYPTSKKIMLKENYRSNQDILDASISLISKNDLRISNKLEVDKNLKSSKGLQEGLIENSEFSSSYLENYFICQKVKSLIDNGADPSEIAIIYRNNSDGEDIADMLSRHKIKYTIEGGQNILFSGIITRFLVLLSVIENIENASEDINLFTLLNYEFIDCEPLDVLKLARFASVKKFNLFDALESRDNINLNLKHPEKIKEWLNKLVFFYNESKKKLLYDFIQLVIEESGFLDWILSLPERLELLNILNSFLIAVKNINLLENDITLKRFLNYVDLMKEHSIAISEQNLMLSRDNIRLMTAHKSKGLEFDYVFIPKFIDKKWGNSVTRDLLKLPYSLIYNATSQMELINKDLDIEDERRLFFVSLTRAKSKIFITSSKLYIDKAKEVMPSQFLHEIDGKYVKKEDSKAFEEASSDIIKTLFVKSTKVTTIDDENAFIKESLSNFKVSASTLSSYLECHYKFKLDYLLKTPKPTERPLALGNAIHLSLKNAYLRLSRGVSVDLPFLQLEFETALRAEFLNEKDFEEILKEGKQLIETYYKVYEQDFNSQKDILFLEKWFGGAYNKTMIDRISLIGRIDKVEVIDKQNKLIKIVDYKTGKPKSLNDILGKTAESDGSLYRQLIFYKLLVELDRTINYKVAEVELDFIGDRKTKPVKHNFVIDSSEVEALKGLIKDVYNSIMSLNFEKTKDARICERCKYRFHCWPDGIIKYQDSQMNLI